MKKIDVQKKDSVKLYKIRKTLQEEISFAVQVNGKTRDIIKTKKELLVYWNKGWDCFFELLFSLKPEQLSEIIYIRNEKHTVIEAINRQLAHYPYHIGQIVFYAKQLNNSEWDSLSIKKNKSRSYNDEKFSQDKKT